MEIKLTGGTPFQNPNDVSEKFYNIKLSGPNMKKSLGFSRCKFLIENLESGNYYLEVDERDFMSSRINTAWLQNWEEYFYVHYCLER